jgi:hypothetical protein
MTSYAGPPKGGTKEALLRLPELDLREVQELYAVSTRRRGRHGSVASC